MNVNRSSNDFNTRRSCDNNTVITWPHTADLIAKSLHKQLCYDYPPPTPAVVVEDEEEALQNTSRVEEARGRLEMDNSSSSSSSCSRAESLAGESADRHGLGLRWQRRRRHVSSKAGATTHIAASFRPLKMLILFSCYVVLLNNVLLFTSAAESMRTFSCGKLYYRTVLHDIHKESDHKESESLYVGAMNHMFALNMDNINASACHTPAFEPAYRRECESQGRSPLYQCQNHIRVVQKVVKSDEYGRRNVYLYVCGTNAYRPKDWLVHASNLSEVANPQIHGLGDGVAKCPFDPDDNHTAVWVDNGNPGDYPALYSATVADSTKSDSLIFRSDLYDANRMIAYPYMRTISYESNWLNKPNFVASFEIGDYVYFFFREAAMEYMNCGKKIYSRVARVCKSDTGGATLLDQNWSSFLKARLNCSVPGDFPFYFDQLLSVKKLHASNDPTDITFYATFTTLSNPSSDQVASAVCSYKMKDIERAFEGKFKEQASATSAWLPVLRSEVPSPRPGRCVTNSKSQPDNVLTFIKSHPLMDETVAHQYDQPLFFDKNSLITHIEVIPELHAGTGKYTVLFAALSDGRVLKIVHWYDWLTKKVHSNVVNEMRAVAPSSVRWIKASVKYNSVYVASDEKVVQFSLTQCRSHATCRSCASDPHCAWSVDADNCQAITTSLRYYPDEKFIQDVQNKNPNICDKTISTKGENVLLGQSAHLKCVIPQAANNVVWTKDGVRIRTGRKALYTVGDNGIVILDTTIKDAGTYEAMINNHLQCRIELTIDSDSCKVPENKEDYKRIYHSWCEEHHQYKREILEFQKIKNQCLNMVL